MYMSENAIMVKTAEAPELFGLMAEYPNVDSLLAAAKRVQAEGYTCWDCHTPLTNSGNTTPMSTPVIAPPSDSHGKMVGLIFITLSKPCTGNGVWQSQHV